MVVFEDSSGLLLRRAAGDELQIADGDLVAVKTHNPDQTRMARVRIGPADSIRHMGVFLPGSGYEAEGATDYLLTWQRDEGYEPARAMVCIGSRTHMVLQ